MSDLPTLLRDLAGEARGYADPDRAIAAARRRRTNRLAASASAVAVVAMLGGVSCLLLAGGRDRFPPPGGGPDQNPPPVASASADTVPPRVRALYPPTVAPHPDAPYLGQPAAPPPGAAAFLYAPCPRGDCWPYLVGSDGTQYRLPPQAIGYGRSEGSVRVSDGQPWDLTLSPDGRYAGWRNRDANGWYRVVDLRTGRGVELLDPGSPSPFSPWAWSPDSTLLLLAEHRDGDVARYLLLDTRDPSGDYRELPASLAGPNGTVVGVRNNGELLVWVGEFGGGLPQLRIVDPDTGKATVIQPPAAAGLLAEGERVLGLLASPCDCAVSFRVYAPGETGRASALLGMDLALGHLTGRIDLPTSADHGGAQPGVWEVAASLPGGTVLVRYHPDGTDIEILNDVNGERVVVTRLPVDAHVTVRGQVR